MWKIKGKDVNYEFKLNTSLYSDLFALQVEWPRKRGGRREYKHDYMSNKVGRETKCNNLPYVYFFYYPIS